MATTPDNPVDAMDVVEELLDQIRDQAKLIAVLRIQLREASTPRFRPQPPPVVDAD